MIAPDQYALFSFSVELTELSDSLLSCIETDIPSQLLLSSVESNWQDTLAAATYLNDLGMDLPPPARSAIHPAPAFERTIITASRHLLLLSNEVSKSILAYDAAQCALARQHIAPYWFALAPCLVSAFSALGIDHALSPDTDHISRKLADIRSHHQFQIDARLGATVARSPV